jgi:hypothetical protein
MERRPVLYDGLHKCSSNLLISHKVTPKKILGNFLRCTIVLGQHMFEIV